MLSNKSALISQKKDNLLSEAMKIEGNYSILVNVLSKRVKQLYAGNRPLIETKEDDDNLYIALREFVEGKISYEPIEI